MSSVNNSSYYGSSSSTSAPIVASPTWSYSSPSQLARKYANIAPIWCHITKPRQLKKKFASTFHQAQSLVNFYNEDRAPSERRGSLTQSQQTSQASQSQSQQPQQLQQSSSSQSSVHNVNTPRIHHDANSYRQQYASHYPNQDLISDPSGGSGSSSRAKKKYSGGALTMHISSRLQSPPPPPLSTLAIEEKFANPGERKARIDQLKDLVFNTRVKDTMIGRTDSKNRSTTNLHKANSYKRIDQLSNSIDDYQSPIIPPATPARKDSHYYHYHLPSSSVSSSIHENLNRPMAPGSSSAASTAGTTSTAPSHSSYNYDYLRAKSKEHTRPGYHEPTYITSSSHTTEIPSSSQIGSSNSTYVGSALATNPLNSYRGFDDHSYINKQTSNNDKNTSYSAITAYPSYQTPGSSKRRIKKYLLAKGTNSSGLSHQTEPITSNLDNLAAREDDKGDDEESSSVVIANTHVITPSPPLATTTSQNASKTLTSNIVPSLQSTPPIPVIPTLTPASSPAPALTSSNATAEPAVFSTPNAQLSPSPPSTNINSYNNNNNKIPPVIVVPLSASLTSLSKQQQQQQQQQSFKSATSSALELLSSHTAKEQSPSRSIVPSITEDGWEFTRFFFVVMCILEKH